MVFGFRPTAFRQSSSPLRHCRRAARSSSASRAQSRMRELTAQRFPHPFAVCPRRLSSNTSPSIDCAPGSIAVTPYCFNTVRRSSSMASGRVEQRIPAKPYVSHAACAVLKAPNGNRVDCREAAAEKCDLGVLRAPHLLCCALRQRHHFFRLRLMIFTRNAVLITEAALLRATVVRNKN